MLNMVTIEPYYSLYGQLWCCSIFFITNPFNKASFSFNSVGFLYDSLVTNDLVNDPTNLRVIYKNATTAIDLGGFGNNAKKGSIVSNAGSSGFGFYTAGNSLGGNNMLSTVEPIALITTVGHCSNDSIIFSATNSSSDSAIVFWKWSITGPSTILSPENTITIKKSLAVAGDYTVTLIVMNKLGFTDTTTKSISIDDSRVIGNSSDIEDRSMYNVKINNKIIWLDPNLII